MLSATYPHLCCCQSCCRGRTFGTSTQKGAGKFTFRPPARGTRRSYLRRHVSINFSCSRLEEVRQQQYAKCASQCVLKRVQTRLTQLQIRLQKGRGIQARCKQLQDDTTQLFLSLKVLLGEAINTKNYTLPWGRRQRCYAMKWLLELPLEKLV